VTITRQEGFYRLAREYVAMQGAPRTPGVFSELYIRGFEAAVETALDRQEEGRTISWVRLAYDRVVDDVLWMEEGAGFVTQGRIATIVTLLQFEWGLHGQGQWVERDFGDDDMNMPEWMHVCRLGDIIGHKENDVLEIWRLWPSGWEKWVV
jgi:hypothetical protein